jgi:hypothetical protein
MEIKKIRKRKEKQRNRFKTLAIVLFERLGSNVGSYRRNKRQRR